MKYWFLLLCLLIPKLAVGQTQEACLAWFTDASIANSIKTEAPGYPLPSVPGTAKNGVNLVKPLAISDSLLSQKCGIISFWLKPNWNGSDSKRHKILNIGDPSKNGLLVEKSPVGTLRFVMAGKNGADVKVTAIRTGVSNWKSGDWHHVMVSWIDGDNSPVGLAMWVDKVPIVSDTFGGTEFMNPSAMPDKNVYIGDATSDAVMDELIFRNTCGDMATAYRDYFRTAPYSSIQITYTPQHIKSDKRVIAGSKKQFAVVAIRVINPAKGTRVADDITCFDGPRYSWDDIDGRQYITWKSSDESKATVDSNGLVTGVDPTSAPITLSARFRGMTATYPLAVISANQPDLDLMYVERTPKYRLHTSKIWPDTGEEVTSIVHYGNFGYKTCNSFKIKFELIRDNNLNFVLDAGDTTVGKPVIREIKTPLAPGNKTGTVSFKWKWPAGNAGDPPVFVKVTLDPDNTVAELCEANNERCDLNTGRIVHWGYGRDAAGNGNTDGGFVSDYNNKVINLVGSFSDYDWCQANVERLNIMLRQAVWPTTSPVGIRDSARVDMFHTLDEYLEDHNNPHGLYQGGYEEMWDTRMTLSPGNIHEMGHTCLGLPDLYGHTIAAKDIFVEDENGNPCGETPLIPVVLKRVNMAPWSSTTWGYPDALGVGYTPLMIYNHLWLEPHSAGWVNKYAKTRKGLGDYGSKFGVMVPKRNSLKILDINDEPLKNARVYVYQCVNTGYVYMPNKFYPNRPKFVFTDGGTGTYTFPTRTCSTWDDSDTDGVEGEVPCMTPFDHGKNGELRAESPNWQAGNLLLFKIVSNGKTEFKTFSMSDMNVAFFSGNKDSASYPIQTSLTSSTVTPEVELPHIPDAISKKNLKPVAKVNDWPEGAKDLELDVKIGQKITFDGSASYDPEGQPLQYRWDGPGRYSWDPIRTIDTSTLKPGDYEVKFYVNDGLRYSDLFMVTLHVK